MGRGLTTRVRDHAPLTGVLAREGAGLALRAMVGGVVGVALGVGAHALDGVVPVALPGDPASAHTLLVTLMGALVTVAVFALWMRSVVVGLLANQFSARTIVQRLDDPFQRAVTGWMVGLLGFVGATVVLLPTQVGEGVPPFAFGGSVVAVVAGLLSVLLAVRHAADSLDTSTLVHRLAASTLTVLGQARSVSDDRPPPTARAATAVTTIRADRLGWVRDVDQDALLELLPAGAVAHLEVSWGSFVAPRRPLLTVDAPLADGAESAVRAAVVVGDTRDPLTDLGFALQQLVDVVEHALTPASADASTAQEAVAHLEVLLRDLVDGGLPSGHRAGEDGRFVVLRDRTTASQHVERVARRLRFAASSDPLLAPQVAEVFADLAGEADRRERPRLARALRAQHEALAPAADTEA
ncbi:DUF2254 domain-containing protein [Nitriliruptoraceae bacterium ZYF776]|nr:DUF2254 domain-containing protein [Profundirhabdus halotolerans]